MSDVVTSGGRAATGAGWRGYAAPLLLGSLALNLLLIGGMVGGYFAAHGHGGLAHQPIERGIVAFVRSLPRERAEALLRPIEGLRPQFKDGRRTLREARGAAYDAFTTDSVDADKLRGALTRAGEAEDRLQAMGTQLFVDLAQKMTPEERKAYRTWRESQDHHGKRHEK